MHTTTLHKVGDSVLMAVPPAVLDELRLRPGESVGISAKTGHLWLHDPLDLDAQLEELGMLRDGWLNGEGQALSPSALRKLASLFRRYLDPALPPPRIYPTPQNGVQAEWTFGRWEAELEIALSNLQAEYFAAHMETDETREQMLSLHEAAAWATLNRELTALQKTTK